MAQDFTGVRTACFNFMTKEGTRAGGGCAGQVDPRQFWAFRAISASILAIPNSVEEAAEVVQSALAAPNRMAPEWRTVARGGGLKGGSLYPFSHFPSFWTGGEEALYRGGCGSPSDSALCSSLHSSSLG